MLRTWACFCAVGEEAVDHVHDAAEHGRADGLRSVSLAAHAHISSSDFGGLRTSNRPMARAGASAHAATSAMPMTASRPSVVAEMGEERSGSE